MALKALIFATDYSIYLNFIREYHLNGSECKYVHSESSIQGYHKDTNPDLLLIFLNEYIVYLGEFWLPRADNSDTLHLLVREFRQQAYNRDSVEVAARLLQLTYITKQEQLPEYLSHESEEVRMAALKRQEELNGQHNNS